MDLEINVKEPFLKFVKFQKNNVSCNFLYMAYFSVYEGVYDLCLRPRPWHRC